MDDEYDFSKQVLAPDDDACFAEYKVVAFANLGTGFLEKFNGTDFVAKQGDIG